LGKAFGTNVRAGFRRGSSVLLGRRRWGPSCRVGENCLYLSNPPGAEVSKGRENVRRWQITEWSLEPAIGVRGRRRPQARSSP